MLRLNKIAKLVPLLMVVAVFYGCKTIPSSSGGSSGNPSSGGTTASSPSSSSVPSSSGSSGSSGGNSGKESGEQQAGGGEYGRRSEDGTLSKALEEFEKARERGQGQNSDSKVETEQTASNAEETDFPMILPSGGEQGEEVDEQAASEAGGEGASGSESGGAQTGEEKVAVLDRRLEESYGKFEGMILRERGHVRDRENARGSGAVLDGDADAESAGGASEGTEQGSSQRQGSGEGNEPITGSGSGSRPEGGDQREGDYQHAAATHAPPPDIPDGSDDDVVARQLREAAMKESDPELREKLWDEYRKYKNKTK